MKKILVFLVAMAMLLSCSNEGDKLPVFDFTTVDGNSISAKDLAGKITVINVWATWCGNCINELGQLNQLADRYQNDDKVVFLGLADEKPEKIQAFLARRPFNYTLVPNGKELTDALQTRLVKTYPQHLVLGPDLTIAYEATGELGDAVGILSAEIEKLR